MLRNLFQYKACNCIRIFSRVSLFSIQRQLRHVNSVTCAISASRFFNNSSNSKSESLHHRTMSEFRFSDYDCIGFDLDSTIIHYNTKNLVNLAYDTITNFLEGKKGYNPKFFNKPLTDKDFDFLRNGLFIDFDNGNILTLSAEGKVCYATHGTTSLNSAEIEKYYPNQEWELGKIFCKNPLSMWNGPLSSKIRSFLCVFDIPAVLVFAKAVDGLDKENGSVLDHYNIWPDIQDAFIDMYSREQLQNNAGNFFSAVKNNPSKYIHKCNPETLEWIKRIKQNKKTFLITGSNSDFVELTTGYAFSENLNSLFDIVVCYAKKPGFFTDNRPFYSLKNYYEDKIVNSKELEVGGIYNQGNWKELVDFFSRITGVNRPRCLYVGDNLLQDIYAPRQTTNCDTMVISEEQLAEQVLHHDLTHPMAHIVNSNVWGSFFSLKTTNGYTDSYWNYIIKKYSKICIPKLEMVMNKPLDEPLKCFIQEDDDKELSGYHPSLSSKPVSVSSQSNK